MSQTIASPKGLSILRDGPIIQKYTVKFGDSDRGVARDRFHCHGPGCRIACGLLEGSSNSDG
jgi:hypothetical protein